ELAERQSTWGRPSLYPSPLDVSADGRWVLSSSRRGRLRLWDAIGGKEACSMDAVEGRERGRETLVHHVRLGRDGRTAVGLAGEPNWRHRKPAGEPKALLLRWDLAGKRAAGRREVAGGWAGQAAVGPDRRWVYCAGRGWDAATGAQIAALEGGAGGREDFAFSPDGLLLVGGWRADHLLTPSPLPRERLPVRVYEAMTGKVVAEFVGSPLPQARAVHPGGRLVAPDDRGRLNLGDPGAGQRGFRGEL